MSRLVRVIALRVAVGILGLLFAVLLVEGGIRLAYHVLPIGLQIALNDVYVTPFSDDTLSPPPLWQSDTDYLTIVRPGAVDSLQAGSPNVTFHVTSYSWWGGRVGFRSPAPSDGNVQAVALGDSFTFCFTELADCWVTQLVQHTGLKLSNLGQPVTGSTSHARLYNDFVAKPELNLQQPKLVLWQFFGNDYNDDYGLALLNQTAKTPPDPPTPSPVPATGAAGWLVRHSVLDALITSLRTANPGTEQFVDRYHISTGGLNLSFGQPYIQKAFDMNNKHNLEGEGLSHDAILSTRATVEKNGGKFIILLIPTKEEVYRTLTEPIMGQSAVDAIAAPRLRMLKFCQDQKLTCLDVLPSMQGNMTSQLYYATDQHLNATGNQIVAEEVGQFLQAQGLASYTP